jgi:hypothetical protein
VGSNGALERLEQSKQDTWSRRSPPIDGFNEKDPTLIGVIIVAFSSGRAISSW